jgi:hypothetical protein
MDRLLMGLSRLERRVLHDHDIPFGSSVLLAAARR